MAPHEPNYWEHWSCRSSLGHLYSRIEKAIIRVNKLYNSLEIREAIQQLFRNFNALNSVAYKLQNSLSPFERV